MVESCGDWIDGIGDRIDGVEGTEETKGIGVIGGSQLRFDLFALVCLALGSYDLLWCLLRKS